MGLPTQPRPNTQSWRQRTSERLRGCLSQLGSGTAGWHRRNASVDRLGWGYKALKLAGGESPLVAAIGLGAIAEPRWQSSYP
jgi:hypothetical protein